MIKPKSHIQSTQPVHHGAFDYSELAQLGLSDDDIIDFSVNSNPYGPPPGVHEAILRVPLDRYPDRDCLAVRRTLADLHHVEIESIVVGNGTAELLQLIAFAFLRQGDSVLIPKPTFSEYERAAQLMGAEASIYAGRPALDTVQMVFQCNPNNPDGQWSPPHEIHTWAQAHPATLFVIDEAYSNFLEMPQSMIGSGAKNVLVVRSMTKDYAMAGLRLGYVVGDPALIDMIQRVRPAWNVNSLAQAAGIAALNSLNWLTETIAQLHQDKQTLIDDLHHLGLRPLPSHVHYFLIPVDDGAAFRSKLLHHRIMVRDCASFGLPTHVRIATRTPQDNHRLLDAIRKISI